MLKLIRKVIGFSQHERDLLKQRGKAQQLGGFAIR